MVGVEQRRDLSPNTAAAIASRIREGSASDRPGNAQSRPRKARLRNLFDAIDHGFCIIEVLFDQAGGAVDYRFLDVNSAFETQTGLSDVVGKTMRALRPNHEEHWFRIYGAVAKTGNAIRFDNPAAALDRWYDVYAFRVGVPHLNRVAVLFEDITVQKRNAERLALLAAEASHRANNILALVASMVRLTNAATTGDYRNKLLGRIDALVKTQRLLATAAGAELGQLVADELAPYPAVAAERVRWHGPVVFLGATAAQSMGLVLHELATNAAKYGALAVAAGRIDITWDRAEDGTLLLCWTESEGPPVVAPTTFGLGSRVIASSVKDQLAGDIELSWRPEGLRCRLSLPAGRLAA